MDSRILALAAEGFIKNSPHPFFVKDSERRYIFASEAYARLIGAACPAALVGGTDERLMSDRALIERFEAEDKRALASKRACEQGEIFIINGRSYKTIRFTASAPDGMRALCGVCRDMTCELALEREKRTRETLKHRACTDPLTGLPNRKAVVERVRSCISDGSTHALLFIDLDQFKQVNDTLGHLSGDRVLREVARRLRGMFRSRDVIGRVGGDEFIVLLRDVGTPEDALRRAREVERRLTLRRELAGRQVTVTCSVGVTLCTGDKSFEELYEEADRAMYRAKLSGSHTAELF